MSKSGIYKIENLINGKVYIGKATTLKSRLRNHKSSLRNNNHFNLYLQRSWNKYGEENFSFEIMEYCDKNILTQRENYWMSKYKSYEDRHGYNVLSPNENLNSYTFPKHIRQKMSEMSIKYTDEEMLLLLNMYYQEFGKIPTIRDLRHNNGIYPNSGTYCIRFGSFKNALIKAGLYDLIENKKDFDREKYDKNEIIKNVKNFVLLYERFPEGKDFCKENNLPSSSTIFRIFSTIDGLMHECGYTHEYFKNIEQTKALESLKKLYKEKGKINKFLVDECEYTKSLSYYVKNFGLNNAYKLAGINQTQNIIS